MLKPRRLLPTSFYRVSRTVADYSACRQHPYGFYQTRAPSTALYIRSATAAVDKTNAVFTFARFIPILLCSLEAVQTGTYKFPSCQKLSYRRHNASCITNSTNIQETIIVIDGYIQASSRLFINATFCIIAPRASPRNKNVAKIAIFAPVCNNVIVHVHYIPSNTCLCVCLFISLSFVCVCVCV